MIWVNIEFQVKMVILNIQVFQNGDNSIPKIEMVDTCSKPQVQHYINDQ